MGEERPPMASEEEQALWHERQMEISLGLAKTMEAQARIADLIERSREARIRASEEFWALIDKTVEIRRRARETIAKSRRQRERDYE